MILSLFQVVWSFLLAVLLLAAGVAIFLPVVPGVFAYKAARKASALNPPKDDVERIARSVDLMRTGRAFEGSAESFAVFAIGCFIQYGVLFAAFLLVAKFAD